MARPKELNDPYQTSLVISCREKQLNVRYVDHLLDFPAIENLSSQISPNKISIHQQNDKYIPRFPIVPRALHSQIVPTIIPCNHGGNSLFRSMINSLKFSVPHLRKNWSARTTLKRSYRNLQQHRQQPINIWKAIYRDVNLLRLLFLRPYSF